MSGLLQVAVGLGDVGGAAHLGRLIATTLAGYAAERGLPFEVFDLGRRDPGLRGVVRRGFAGRRAAMVREVLGRQAHERPRLVVFDHLGPCRIQALLPPPLRAPHAVFILGIEVWRPLGWQRRHVLASAQRVFAISDTTLAQARPFLPPGVHPTVVHPSLEDAAPQGEPDGGVLERCGEGFALVVGRLERDRKGHDELLGALRLLRRRVPGAKLVIAGSGADQARLERLAAELGLGEATVFTGLVSEATLKALYERCAVFVMPSRGEGFGLVFLEAMRAGKPCVALADTAPAEILLDGETGLLVRDGDLEHLGEALAWLLERPERAACFGDRGRERYRQRFTAAAFSKRLSPHLDALLHQNPEVILSAATTPLSS